MDETAEFKSGTWAWGMLPTVCKRMAKVRGLIRLFIRFPNKYRPSLVFFVYICIRFFR